MLNGKAWPKAVRGLHMVAAAILDDSINCGATRVEALVDELDGLPTGRMWIDCLIMPVVIIHMFLRAEREGDWLLHLYCVKQMLPYFFSAGHWNYARYGFWYLCEMQGALPDAAKEMFMTGDHVCRHREGVWNAVFSDQFREQTYIRYGKAKGGLVGLILSSDQVAGWVLSYHIGNMVSLSMDDMFQTNDDENAGTEMKRHKEEGLKGELPMLMIERRLKMSSNNTVTHSKQWLMYR